MGKTVVSYGGGTNSTALLILLQRRKITPDAILFADTGGERAETYSYIEYFNKWLQKNGMPQITIVKYKTKDGVNLTLEEDIINNKTLPAIAFGWKTCSQKFKIQPQVKWIKENFPKEEIKMLIGFDASERRRMKENPERLFTNIYPLIEDQVTREDCIKIILDTGLCLPNKSSCFFCPNMKSWEILKLSENERNRAIKIEANATNVVELKGLGRNYSWTDLINANKEQLTLFDDLEMFQTPCACID